MYLTYKESTLSKSQLDRINALKDASLSVEQEVCVERARYLTEAYQEHIAEPMIKRRAYAFKNVLDKITLFIEDGQLLAGNHVASLRAASIFPEYCIDWIFEEIDELPNRPGDRVLVSPAVRTELLEIASKLAPAESFILPVEDTTQETAGEGQGDDASEEEQQEDPLKGLYGVYDFNALQIYSLEKCIEYSTVKDNIPPGGERISADVIKIPRQLFETGKYYLCMDNQKAAVYIDPTPVDIDAEPASDASENAPQEGSSEEEGGED